MLIGSHFLEETEEELHTINQLFQESLHRIHSNRIAEQLALLFSHDEIRATCSYE